MITRLDAAFRHDEVGADGVRVVVDARDHPGRDVLDPPAVGEPRLLGDGRHDPVEGRARRGSAAPGSARPPPRRAGGASTFSGCSPLGPSPARSRPGGSRARPGRRPDPSRGRTSAMPPGRAARGCAAAASRATSRPCTSPGCRTPRSTAACGRARSRRERVGEGEAVQGLLLDPVHVRGAGMPAISSTVGATSITCVKWSRRRRGRRSPSGSGPRAGCACPRGGRRPACPSRRGSCSPTPRRTSSAGP